MTKLVVSTPRSIDPIARFRKTDANGDGQLSTDELSTRTTDRLPTFDGNGDGSNSLEEYDSTIESFGRVPSTNTEVE